MLRACNACNPSVFDATLEWHVTYLTQTIKKRIWDDVPDNGKVSSLSGMRLRLEQQAPGLDALPEFAPVNRAPAKTQSALLEAMQENQVTIEGTTLPLSQPFMVLATQNPVEQEGVYRLPEAQLDRAVEDVGAGHVGRQQIGRELRMFSA